MRDALDDQITHHVRGVRAPDEILWPAFLAMWKRIGSDCAIDFIVWCAHGESIGDGKPRPHAWPAPSDELRDSCRTWLDRILSGGAL